MTKPRPFSVRYAGLLMVAGMVLTITGRLAHPAYGSDLGGMEMEVAKPAENTCTQALEDYQKQLFHMVEGEWQPPLPVHPGQWESHLRYTVRHDGKVENVMVVRTSGNPALDESAVKQLEQYQGQYPKLPACVEPWGLEVEHTFTAIKR